MFDEKNTDFDEVDNNGSSENVSESASEIKDNREQQARDAVLSSVEDINGEQVVYEQDVYIPQDTESQPETTDESDSFDPDKTITPSDIHTADSISGEAVISRTQPEGYYGGVAYTKNVDGENKNGYEWNSNFSEQSSLKADKKSGRGFRVFIGCILTVFTVSVAALAVMVAAHISNGGTFSIVSDNSTQDTQNKTEQSTSNTETQSVPAKPSNFVVYDPSEFEGEHLSIPQIAAKCSPSSVGIISQVEVSYSYPFGFGSSKGISEASGSGFIYSSDGYIITNHHVVEDAKEVTVILHDGTEYKAEVVGSDSLSDIAVLKITPKEGATLVPMEIGNSDELVVGESVVAIGCPAGIEFIGTVTDGIVSAINRNVEITDSYGTVQKTMTLIQTNATINQGNSGGPLINSRGQVIGINTLKLNSSSYEGIGFSIPMNGAMPVIKQLIEHGKVIERTQDDFAYGKGVIGISGRAIPEDESEYYNIPMGVLVLQIDKNSSAAKAGLRRGDIITHYNGKEVESVEDINEAKGSGRVGEQVTVTVYRDSENGIGDGQTIDITFTLDSQK